MTKTKQSDLILFGREVKLRLTAERIQTKTLVHVDWVRFTCRVKNAPLPSVDDLFPMAGQTFDSAQRERMAKALAEMDDPDFSVSVQAKTLADQTCEALGPDFTVAPEVRKGQDFYRFRWAIVRNDIEVGWVGYLASGDSPRQKSQSSTIHVNLHGTACTFAQVGFNHRLGDLVRSTDAVITRVDLALDFFDGITGGMERVRQDYMSGLMDNRGNRPKATTVGAWPMNRERSFYVGSKEAGKQTNIYEKGHQLFGPKDESPWVRCELRYGNKLRVLEADILDRPSHYFAGASDWHASILREADGDVYPVPVPVKSRLASESVLAEVSRNVRWCFSTAGASLALAFKHLGVEEFMQLVEHQKLPGRLQKFTQNEVVSAYQNAFQRITGSGFGRLGLDPYQAVTA